MSSAQPNFRGFCSAAGGDSAPIAFARRVTACGECRSIRVGCGNFRPTKSQRRTLSRNQHVRVQWRPVQATQGHVDLLNAWQAEMSRRKGWQPVVMTPGRI